MSDRPEFTITEAAKACGVSAKTIRRRLQKGKLPNAYRRDGPAGTDTGPWVVPVEDLIAAGLQPGKPSPPDDDVAPTATADIETEPTELEKLKHQVADLRRRAEVAEAIAQERDRTIESQSMALRMLETGPAPADVALIEHRARAEAATEQLDRLTASMLARLEALEALEAKAAKAEGGSAAGGIAEAATMLYERTEPETEEERQRRVEFAARMRQRLAEPSEAEIIAEAETMLHERTQIVNEERQRQLDEAAPQPHKQRWWHRKN